jgi:hypothetical protein
VQTQLGDLLDQARERCFVGRRDEVTSFDDALSGRSARRVLILHGPGGIGKTTLLQELRRRAPSAALLDGWQIDPSPAGFRAALGNGPPGVLLVDSYEQLAPIDAWLRNEFVPGLGASTVLVLAGREKPAAEWRTDPGWRRLVAIHRLDPLDAADAGALLTRAGVDPRWCDRLLALGRGHPLALALLADATAAGTVPATLAEVPELITALLEALVRDAPSDAHAVGLATCAQAWLTTEDLLRDAVGPAAGEVWAWLRLRPFVTYGAHGLAPHDLVRDVLEAEFERRCPQRYRELHRIIHDHVVDGLRAGTGTERQLLAQHLLFLHRRSPLTSAFFTLRARGSATVTPGRRADHDAVVSIVDRFRGRANAELAREWLTEQPGALSVVRTEDGVAGFICGLLCPTGSGLEERDPVVRAALAHVARHGPARPGELVDIERFMGGAREYERDLYAVLVASVTSIIDWVTRPLAWTFVVVTDPEFWGPFFDYLAFTPAFEIEDGGHQVVYAIDWRRLPVDVWLGLMSEREHSGGGGPAPAELLRPAPIGRDAFAAAVRAALHAAYRPDRRDEAGPIPQARLRAAIEQLPLRSAAVLTRTYLKGAPTQEAAAEVLGLPFSTYRRHLSKAVEQLTELLWAAEIGATRIKVSTR